MGRYTGPNCRLCRREGLKLFLKGVRCVSPKCALSRREYAPGQHGQRRRSKASNYGMQLREKQKVKRIYGVREQQFRRYFSIASRIKGITGKILLQILERRLDNALFQGHFAASRQEARQIVRHRHVLVNGKIVNIPSYLIKEQDLISVGQRPAWATRIKKNIEVSKERQFPSWIEFNQENLSLKILRLPEKEDIQLPIQEQLIVELYSK